MKTAAERLTLAVVLVFAIALPARADFSSLARAVSRQPGVSKVWMPFLGLARVAVRIVEPKGVHDFQLAMFKGKGLEDGKRFGELVARHAGKGFQPLVKVRERNGDWSYVYARPGRGELIELLVFAHDSSGETVLVRVQVDAAIAARELAHPKQMAAIGR